MTEQEYWKHVWPCSQVLGDFIVENGSLFRNSVVLELGCGGTGAPGILSHKCGAKHVIFSDHPDRSEAFSLLRENCRLNGVDRSFSIQGLDWNSAESASSILGTLNELDFIIASDVFYDPLVFEPIVNTVALLLHRFSSAQFIFAYQIRDSSWSIEDLLLLKGLKCCLIRSVDSDQHSFQIGLIYANHFSMDPDKFFIGIEGGATHSHLVVLDTTGKHYGEWENEGLNYYLHGVPQITTKIAEWIRKVKKELEIVGPIAAVGMGLSGAEDEKINKQVINILRVEHGDVAKVFVITTDSLITIATAFDKGGVVLIAGTGSSCRLLKSDSSVKRVGGWGHLIGDGGSAFWIANNALRTVCDDDDGLSPAPYPTKRLKMLILKHFKVPDMVGMLDLLYTNFVKSNIASLTKSLAVDGIGDPMVREIFRQAGEALGRHIRAISRYLDESMLSDIPVVTVGSVWKSWPLLKQGFIEGVRDPERKIKAVTLHRLEETPAVGAALMAAKNNGVEIPLKQRTKVLDVIDCRRIDKVQESGPGSRTNAVTHPSAEINEVAIDHQTKLDDGRYSQTMNPYRSTC